MLSQHWKVAIFAILLMTGFTFFSHGTQDIYPIFLRQQHRFSPPWCQKRGDLPISARSWADFSSGSFSQHFGRRSTIILVALLALPVSYLWAF